MLILPEQRDGLDLDEEPVGQPRSHGRARRVRRGEPLLVDPVVRLEVREIAQERRDLDHVVHPTAGRGQAAFDVVEDLPGLFLDPAGDERVIGSERDLPRCEHQWTGHDDRAVRRPRSGHVGWLSCIPGHGDLLSIRIGSPNDPVSPTVDATSAPLRAPCSSASSTVAPERRIAR